MLKIDTGATVETGAQAQAGAEVRASAKAHAGVTVVLDEYSVANSTALLLLKGW